MITLKQESTLIKKLKSLTEMELQIVFEELSEHIHKNYWGDMVQSALGVRSIEDDLRYEIKDLEYDKGELERDKDELEDKISDALDILNGIEDLDEETEKQVNKVINILS